jgi:hypothetical protein
VLNGIVACGATMALFNEVPYFREACMAMLFAITSWQFSDELVSSLGLVRQRRIFVPGQLLLVVLLYLSQLAAIGFLIQPRHALTEMSGMGLPHTVFSSPTAMWHAVLVVCGIRLGVGACVDAAVSCWGPSCTDMSLFVATSMAVSGMDVPEVDAIPSLLWFCLGATLHWLLSTKEHDRRARITVAVTLLLYISFMQQQPVP